MRDFEAWLLFNEWQEKEGRSFFELSDEEIVSLIRFVYKKGIMGISKKLCPLLKARGVFDNDSAYVLSASGSNPLGEAKNWIKEICCDCPLDGEEGRSNCCIYDYSGPIKKIDKEALLEVANENPAG